MWTLGTLRLFGKREIGQFTIFDLALILLAAGVLQRGDRRHEAVEASSPTLAA